MTKIQRLMAKIQPGDLVSIIDDEISPCFVVKAEELLSEKIIKLDVDLNYLKAKFTNQCFDVPSFSNQYDVCELLWSPNINFDETSMRRNPEIPKCGMFIKKICVQFHGKYTHHHAALILGPHKKYIIPLHFLSPLKAQTSE